MIPPTSILPLQGGGSGRPHPPADPYGIPELSKDYTEYDPDKANALLDEMGLDKRDSEGFRIGPDGKRFTFVMGISSGIGSREPAVFEIIAEYWREKLGLDVRLNLEESRIWRNRQYQNEQDAIGYSMARYQWVLSPNSIIPVFTGGWMAPLWHVSSPTSTGSPGRAANQLPNSSSFIALSGSSGLKSYGHRISSTSSDSSKGIMSLTVPPCPEK